MAEPEPSTLAAALEGVMTQMATQGAQIVSQGAQRSEAQLLSEVRAMRSEARLHAIYANLGIGVISSNVDLSRRVTNLDVVASVLATLPHLTELSLGENQIVDVTPLQSLTNLTELDLGSNQIEDVAPLQALLKLTWLDLTGNQIQAQDPAVQALEERGVGVNV